MSGRPKAGYRTADGERVPGVTTVCDIIKDSGGLIHWAWQCGVDGIDYREKRDTAGAAGSYAHDMVEAHLTGREFAMPPGVPPYIVSQASRAFENFLAWKRQNRLEIVATELTLVSERHRFGGTMDGLAVAHIGSGLALVDYKTARSVYESYLAQLAAYGKLWEEHHPDQLITGGYHLLKISRDHGDFAHHYWDQLDDAWEAFLHARALYDLKKILKQRAA